MKNYDDIIDFPYDGIEGRARMSLLDRAAQFAPFSALTGFEDLIEDTTDEVNSKE